MKQPNSPERRLFSPTRITSKEIDVALARNPNTVFRVVVGENLLSTFTHVRGLKRVDHGEWTYAEDRRSNGPWTASVGNPPTLKTRDILYIQREETPT